MPAFPFSRFEVQGPSMLPSFSEGERVLALSLQPPEIQEMLRKLMPLHFAEPKGGDVVVLEKNGEKMVKRVSLDLRDGTYLVHGDNSSESTDSRAFGSVKRSEILGRVMFKY